jgi:hypothetical protein
MLSRHYFTMIFIMFISGLLGSRYVWADKVSDIRISVNDIYMIALMTGYMLLFMIVFEDMTNTIWLVFSLLIITVSLWLIRTQRYVSKQQFFTGMIPHHSMAVHMSRRLLQRTDLTPQETEFAQSILKTQEKEIEWMKSKLRVGVRPTP